MMLHARRGLGVLAGLGATAAALHQARPIVARAREAEQGLAKDEFRTLTCTANEPHTHDTHKLTFALADPTTKWNTSGAVANVVFRAGAGGKSCCGCCGCEGECPCPINASTGCCECCSWKGAWLCPKKSTAASKGISRNYNPLSADTTGELQILVKRYGETAKMGSVMHNLKAGDTIDAKGPNQQWVFVKGKYSHYGMIAGGTGLTPIIQATEYILNHDNSNIALATFNKTAQDVVLSDDLHKLQKAFPNRLKVTHFIENVSPHDKVMRGCKEGRVSAPALKEILPPPGRDVLVFQCGRADMTATVAGPKAKDYSQGPIGGILKDLGYEASMVKKL